MPRTPEERLAAARENEERALYRLECAAKRRAEEGAYPGPVEDLKAAAKAWTNAYHQRSRCEKHMREATP